MLKTSSSASPKKAIVFIGVVDAVIFYFYLFLGIGSQLDMANRSLMLLGFLTSPFYLLGIIFKKKKLAQAGLWIPSLCLLGLFYYESSGARSAREQAKTEARNEHINQRLLESAINRIPCENGDVVILASLAKEIPGIFVYVIPNDRKKYLRMLAKKEEATEAKLQAYLTEMKTKCQDTQGNTLFSLLK